MIDRSASNRIAPVDGLRAVAVLGVVWAHVWAFCGNPALAIGTVAGVRIDLNRAVSAFGSGVDLFFVISGFCMYLAYVRKASGFSLAEYRQFITKRWLRIAPAFYVSAVCAAAGFWLAQGAFPLRSLLANMTFLQIWLSDAVLVAPFWSLATEWHFYLILPLLIVGAARWGFWRALLLAAFFSMAVRGWVELSSADVQAFWKPQLPNRLIEFVWGMGVGHLYAGCHPPPGLLRGSRGFLIGAVMAYAGRVLMVTETVRAAGRYGPACAILAEPVMTLGCAVVLWNVVSSDSLFARLLSRTIPRTIGRWSYSLYLWHWWPAWWISGELVARYGATALTQHLAFGLSLIVLLPSSALSYRLLESPYFERRRVNLLTVAA